MPAKQTDSIPLPYLTLGSKWTGPVLSMLQGRVLRFSGLRRGIAGLSAKMLAGLLKQLERDGVVERRHFAVIPPRVDYELTEFGDRLAAASALLSDLATSSRDQIERSRRRFDAKSQPEIFHPTI
ncbi:MAG: helix-turn-helix domain-containing protein [Devosia sp.]